MTSETRKDRVEHMTQIGARIGIQRQQDSKSGDGVEGKGVAGLRGHGSDLKQIA